jgi:hypothetical protein
MRSLPIFYVVLLLHCVLVYGDIDWEVAADNCSQSQSIREAIFYSSGSCYGGTPIGRPGLCLNWVTPRLDPEEPPQCPGTQVMKYGPSLTRFDAGIGNCWGGDECQWQKSSWQWSCCDCPARYNHTRGETVGRTATRSFVSLAPIPQRLLATIGRIIFAPGASHATLQSIPPSCKGLADHIL